MSHPHNVVVVGSNTETPAKFFTQLDPVKLTENVGMAIRSILHGSINNVTLENKKIHFSVNLNPDINPREMREDVLEIEEGNYSSTLAIIKSMALEFSKAFKFRTNRRPRLIKPVRPPYLETNESEMDIAGNGYINFKPKNMSLIFKGEIKSFFGAKVLQFLEQIFLFLETRAGRYSYGRRKTTNKTIYRS